MKIGILGGTFNPPHIGHIHAAVSVREHLKLDKIIFVPSSTPPHKELPGFAPSANERLEMTRIAAKTIDAEVSDIELRRDGVSYTADTVEQMAKLYSGDELFFIVGTDMLLTMQDWHQPKRIFKTVSVAAIARDVGDEEKIKAHINTLEELGAHIFVVFAEPLPISSTKLRDDIRNENMRKFLPNGVFDYIIRKNLYEI